MIFVQGKRNLFIINESEGESEFRCGHFPFKFSILRLKISCPNTEITTPKVRSISINLNADHKK